MKSSTSVALRIGALAPAEPKNDGPDGYKGKRVTEKNRSRGLNPVAEAGLFYEAECQRLQKNYRTAIEADDELALSREYPYYDPIYMLPESGQAWWRHFGSQRSRSHAGPAEVVRLAGSGGQARQDAV